MAGAQHQLHLAVEQHHVGGAHRQHAAQQAPEVAQAVEQVAADAFAGLQFEDAQALAAQQLARLVDILGEQLAGALLSLRVEAEVAEGRHLTVASGAGRGALRPGW
ncbi:hypothetical protein SDC9_178221 [bioreactor metagenome]|uniref:Uncharacterized protein n=1 Tax=bioreactor metagenome TaxID=1076179 RepID=A0A645GWL7_9ZZZZ